jgi:hypothetical protein
MVKNMKQVTKMLEHVNKDMNASELAKVMEKFEQVSFFPFAPKKIQFIVFFSHSKILMLKIK